MGFRDALKGKANALLHGNGVAGGSNSQYPGFQAQHGQIGSHQHPYSASSKPNLGPQTISQPTILNTSSSGTYPRLTRLSSDDSILLSYTSSGVLRVDRSTDGGNSFQPWGEVSRSQNNADVDNLLLLEIPSREGTKPTVLAAFRNHDRDAGGNYTYFRITICQSSDAGQTWSYLSQAIEFPPSPAQGMIGVWEPFLRVADNGDVQVTYSLERASNDQDTQMKVSSDRGATWSSAMTISGGGEKLRDGMNGIARTTNNGREALLMVVETTRQGTFSVESALSLDDGATWGERQSVFVPPAGRNAGAPQVQSFEDGSLACVFMCDAQAAQVNWPKNAAVMVAFSAPPVDGKVAWSDVRTISSGGGSGGYCWPGIFQSSGNGLMAAYEQDGQIMAQLINMPRGHGGGT